MAKVLFIKANPKTDEQSTTFQLANEFVKTYKEKNPNDQIDVLDLYKENVRPIDEAMLAKMNNREDNEMLQHAKKFAEYDKYIFAAPMWNLSFPSILKSYFDYVAYVGVSFKYTETGPVGLLKDKKAVHIVSRGGMYSEGPGAPLEQGDRYVRTILNFFGITDIQTVHLELTNVLLGEQLEQAKQQAFQAARDAASKF
jgi:FMN-dependent NADH-azoreductase